MNDIEKQEIERFMTHGAEIIPDFDIIFCTEKGDIVFVNQAKNTCYAMRFGGMYGNGFAVMQYCTDSCNKWTKAILWMTSDYWKTIQAGYNHKGDE